MAVNCFLGSAFDTADDEQPYGTVTAARSAHLFRPGSRNDGVGSVVADGGGLEIVLHRVSFKNAATCCECTALDHHGVLEIYLEQHGSI